MITSFYVYGQTVANINDIRYLIQDGNAIIGRQDKDLSGDIIIPEFIVFKEDTLPITGMVSPTNITSWSSNTVTTEGGTFQDCNISTIVLPSGLREIPAGAFNGCSKLQEIKLPQKLETIGAACFAGCISLSRIEIPDNVTNFGSYSSYGFISYTFGNCIKLKSINIPIGVTMIHDGCFKGCGLDSVFIHEGINFIGEEAFANTNLRVVKMELKDITQMNYSINAFRNESNINLLVPQGSLLLYKSHEPWMNFKSIEEYGDYNEEIIPDQITIEVDNIIYILKDGKATIGRQSVLLDGDIIIPDSIMYKEVNYPVSAIIEPTDLVCYSNNTITCTGGAFQNSNISSVVLPNSINTIAPGSFYGCKNLQKVTLPPNIQSLGAACFAKCKKLNEIDLPNSITDLASHTEYGYRSYVFGECSMLKEIIIPENVYRLATGCFKDSGLETITIPAGCTIFDEGCLDAPNLKEVTLAVRDMYSMTYTESIFGNISSATLKVPHGSKQVYQEYYPWISFNIIEEFDDGEAIYIPSKITTKIDGIRYVLDEGCATVGRQDRELEGDIVIPEYVTYNGTVYDVTDMINPTNVTAWSSNTVTTENGAFQSCLIRSVSIPSSIQNIPAGAFYGCANLEEVIMEEGLLQLGTACFANCEKLEELHIPNSVTTFGSHTRYGFKSYIFGNCHSLKKVNIPLSVSVFSEGCFKGSGLETFIIPKNVTILEEDCFANCPLKAIKICHNNLDSLTFTESIFADVSDVRLFVPEGKLKLYKNFYPWKNFKEVVEYNDQKDDYQFNAYSITYTIPQEYRALSQSLQPQSSNVHIKQYVASGVSIDSISSPILEGFIFKGWEGIPHVMPSHDIIVEGLFEQPTRINGIYDDKQKKDIFYDMSGRQVTPQKRGLYINNGRKIVIK